MKINFIYICIREILKEKVMKYNNLFVDFFYNFPCLTATLSFHHIDEN